MTLIEQVAQINKAASDGKLPIPPRRGLIPYAGAEIKPQPKVVPEGTIVDGVNCTGMTDDPKKSGVPVYLQAQNRKALTPEQKVVIDAKLAEARSTQEKTMPTTSAPKAKKASGKKTAGSKAKTAKPAKAKTAKSTTKTEAKSKAGSKTEIVAKLLQRASGCTGAEILEATGWPTVSVPAMAKAAGLKLKKEKEKGSPTRYFGS